MDRANLRIGIVCPCPKEYRACAAALDLSAETGIAGRPVSYRSASGVSVFAVQAGAGKINCASATQLIIDRLRPSLVVDTGAAGSLSEQVSVNDVVCVGRSFEYDLVPLHEFQRHAAELTSSTVIQELDEEGIALLMRRAEASLSKASDRFVIGDVACGEHNVRNDLMRRRLCEVFGAIACTWETSATLKIARMNRLPSVGFRVITDNADMNMAHDFNKNLGGALQALFTFLSHILFGDWFVQVLDSLEVS